MNTQKWHWIDWSIFGLHCIWLMSNIIYSETFHKSDLQMESWKLLVLFLIMFLIPQLFWRPKYVNYMLFSLSEIIIVCPIYIYLVYRTTEAVGILVFPCILFGYLARKHTFWWSAPFFVVFVPMVGTIIGKAELAYSLNQVFMHCLFFGIGIGFNVFVHTNKKMKSLLAQIKQQNVVLEQYAKQVEELTIVEERNRLARELHDSIGHSYTSIIYGLEAIKAYVKKGSADVEEKIDEILLLTREGLHDIRRNIHQIAPENVQQPLTEQFTNIVEQFKKHTGIFIELTYVGLEYKPNSQIVLALKRCLQEALTNAIRHGHAKKIDISLHFKYDEIYLFIHDDGHGSNDVKMGFGLTSMKERIDVLQGSLTIQSLKGNGFTLQCSIPVSV